MTPGLSIGRIVRRVSDLDRARAFYAAIGFRPDGAPAPLAGPLAEALGLGPGAIRQQFAIGRQRLDLVATPPGAPFGRGPAANDPAFQHVAIPVRAMDDAMAALARLSPEPITRGGAQILPAASGGVAAFKFRDPDGNALELIHFPSGDGATRWAGAAGLFLGIDHTAVTVTSLDGAVSVFERELGFRVASRGVNRGAEQARLDGLADPVVDVVALAPPGRPTPHLELLHYREPAWRGGGTARPTMTWSILRGPPGAEIERRLSDGPERLAAPDGHGLILETA